MRSACFQVFSSQGVGTVTRLAYTCLLVFRVHCASKDPTTLVLSIDLNGSFHTDHRRKFKPWFITQENHNKPTDVSTRTQRKKESHEAIAIMILLE